MGFSKISSQRQGEYHRGERLQSFGHSFEEVHETLKELGYSEEERIDRGGELQVVYK